MVLYAMINVKTATKEMVLYAGNSVMATLLIPVVIAWSPHPMEEVEDMQYGTTIDATGTTMMLAVVRNMEQSGILNAEIAITMTDVAFAL